MLQTRNSRWTAATVLVCVLILVAAWFLLVDPRRADAADLRDQRAQAAQQNDALQLQIAQLKAQFADLPARQAELAAIRTQLPSKADMPALIRNLDELAKKAGVKLTSITPQPATPVAVADASAAGAAAGGASAGGGAAGGAASGGAAGGAKAAAESSLFAVPTTIAVSGDYFASAQFLRLVQTEMPRAFLVTNLTVERSTEKADTDGAVNLTVAGQIYVLLDSAASAQAAVGAVQGAVQGATGATGSATPTSPTPTAGTSTSPAATPTPTTSASTN